jgi:hypothetical protein
MCSQGTVSALCMQSVARQWLPYRFWAMLVKFGPHRGHKKSRETRVFERSDLKFSPPAGLEGSGLPPPSRDAGWRRARPWSRLPARILAVNRRVFTATSFYSRYFREVQAADRARRGGSPLEKSGAASPGFSCSHCKSLCARSWCWLLIMNDPLCCRRNIEIMAAVQGGMLLVAWLLAGTHVQLFPTVSGRYRSGSVAAAGL